MILSKPLFLLNGLRGKPFNHIQGLRCKGTSNQILTVYGGKVTAAGNGRDDMIVTLLPKSVTPRRNNHCPDSVIVILSSSALRRHGAGTFCVWATFVHKTADRFLTDKNQCPESG